MRFIRFDSDAWAEIVDAITRNRLRSFLTAFGIFWGIFMLVLLMGGGHGIQSALGSVFDGFASNSGFMASMPTSKPYKGFAEGREWQLENADVERVRRAVPEIDIISPSNSVHGQSAVYGSRSVDVTLSGIYPNYLDISDPLLRHGRRINDIDIAEHRKVCLVGKRIVEQLFPGEENVCGRTIAVGGIYYTIIGQTGRTGNGINVNGNALTTIEIPFTTMQRTYGQGDEIQDICFTARSGHNMSAVQDKVEAVLKHAHSIAPDDPQAVLKVNVEAMFHLMDTLFRGISILVWMIGVGTLLSGAIGVSNIMMVTVRERTTEIGIRRAIGATPADILRQILSESMLLTLVAGLIGIVLAVLVLQVVEVAVNSAPDATAQSAYQISFWLAVGATAAIAVLGLTAGITPAVRAMHIRPVDAMRDE